MVIVQVVCKQGGQTLVHASLIASLATNKFRLEHPMNNPVSYLIISNLGRKKILTVYHVVDELAANQQS